MDNRLDNNNIEFNKRIITIIILSFIGMILIYHFNNRQDKGRDNSNSFQEYLDTVHTESTSPLSGYEFDYDPDKWNDNSITDSHNCYDYAFNNIDHAQKVKTQPGELSGINDKEQTFKCDFMEKRLLKDHNNNIYIAKFDEKCKPYHYKIVLMMDDDSDYHFMRQDKNGLWSQKPGPYNITNRDANNNLISNPTKSNNRTSAYNYNKLCNYYCVHNTAEKKFKNNN